MYLSDEDAAQLKKKGFSFIQRNYLTCLVFNYNKNQWQRINMNINSDLNGSE